MSWAVRCPNCHRQERWLAEGPVVDMEGGQRQPKDHPDLAAWRTIRRSLQGELGPVVGSCPACEQPLVAEDPACPERSPWTFTTPNGVYTVNGGVSGPEGALDSSELDAYLAEIYRTTNETDPAQTLFTMTLLTFMTVPVLLWIVTGIIVATILLNFTSSTQVFVPDF